MVILRLPALLSFSPSLLLEPALPATSITATFPTLLRSNPPLLLPTPSFGTFVSPPNTRQPHQCSTNPTTFSSLGWEGCVYVYAIQTSRASEPISLRGGKEVVPFGILDADNISLRKSSGQEYSRLKGVTWPWKSDDNQSLSFFIIDVEICLVELLNEKCPEKRVTANLKWPVANVR